MGYSFIDLFAGLGGFHLALKELECNCVFASEIQPDLRELYKENFGMSCSGDINYVDIAKDIPPHNILCAGFPCQPFSQAGKQQGFDDEERGKLFYKIMEILEYHKPEFIILENVANLKSHNGGNTYKTMQDKLTTLYELKDSIISPLLFEIPHHRRRLYIVGRLKDKGGLKDFEFPIPEKCSKRDFESKVKKKFDSIIDHKDKVYEPLKEITRKQLEVWQNFLDLLCENKVAIPSFPIWAMEFGATYEFENLAPYYQKASQLNGKKGKFGELIVDTNKEDCLSRLPSYSRTKPKGEELQFPTWKKQFIRRNRKFYVDNKKLIDSWIHKLRQDGFENSHQKFEWNCGNEEKPDLYNKIIQFRPSGIRVKRPIYSPTLVLTTTQIPIIPWIETTKGEKGRYMTIKEGAELQGMEKLKNYPKTFASAFKALGNAVNVKVVERIAKELLCI